MTEGQGKFVNEPPGRCAKNCKHLGKLHPNTTGNPPQIKVDGFGVAQSTSHSEGTHQDQIAHSFQP